MNYFTKSLTSLAVVAGAALAANSAQADTMNQGLYETRSVTVSFGDLDLSKEAGAQALYRRLRAASDAVCGPKHDGSRLFPQRHWSTCFAKALNEAVQEVNYPRVSAIHEARTGNAPHSIVQTSLSR